MSTPLLGHKCKQTPLLRLSLTVSSLYNKYNDNLSPPRCKQNLHHSSVSFLKSQVSLPQMWCSSHHRAWLCTMHICKEKCKHCHFSEHADDFCICHDPNLEKKKWNLSFTHVGKHDAYFAHNNLKTDVSLAEFTHPPPSLLLLPSPRHIQTHARICTVGLQSQCLRQEKCVSQQVWQMGRSRVREQPCWTLNSPAEQTRTHSSENVMCTSNNLKHTHNHVVHLNILDATMWQKRAVSQERYCFWIF